MKTEIKVQTVKAIKISVTVLILFFIFSVIVYADDESELWLSGIWDELDEDTEKYLSELGVGVSYEGFLNVSPSKVMELIISMLKGEAISPLKCFGGVLLLMLAVSFICSFLPRGGSLAELGETVGVMFIIFSVLVFSGEIITECRNALALSKNFMLALIPTLAGIVSFSGQPTLALTVNTVMLAFAEVVSVFLINNIPSIASVGSAIAAAGTLDPAMKLSGLVKLFNKAVTVILSFVCAIFVAFLSIRGVIAGAADTVTIKGLRFLIGNSIPIVGSAIGDALNSVVAGLGLVKHTAAALGIIALVFMCLPSFCRLVIWKLLLSVTGVVSEVLENGRIKTFVESLNSVMSALIAVMCFNTFVYIISVAVLMTVKGSV